MDDSTRHVKRPVLPTGTLIKITDVEGCQKKAKRGRVCVGCDYSVSNSLDEMFRPTDDLASRETRKLRRETGAAQ